MADYFRNTPDPERGWALAALTGSLSFRHAKPGLIRGLIEARADPTLFYLSWDYVGDLSETVALMWPKPHLPTGGGGPVAPQVRPGEGGSAASPENSALPPSPGAPSVRSTSPIEGEVRPHVPALSEVIAGLASTHKVDLPRL